RRPSPPARRRGQRGTRPRPPVRARARRPAGRAGAGSGARRAEERAEPPPRRARPAAGPSPGWPPDRPRPAHSVEGAPSTLGSPEHPDAGLDRERVGGGVEAVDVRITTLVAIVHAR